MTDAASFSHEHTPPLGFVYCVIDAARDVVKIGYSANVGRRVRQLQTACPFHLRLHGAARGDRALEQAFHQHFADRRMAGEWFSDTDGVVRETFTRVAQAVAEGRDA